MRLLMRRRRADSDADDRALDSSAKGIVMDQLVHCAALLNLFKTGCLLLDEVDMLLHPLKSELNWPIGEKLPLDFTLGVGDEGPGLRWRIPFHLLDALFYATDGRMTVDFKKSHEAIIILDKITAAVERGVAANVLQTTPHLVLLDKEFYQTELMPLLAEWLLLWLSSHHTLGVADGVALDFLMNGASASSQTRSALKRNVSDVCMQMLNLSHEWLRVLFFHSASKIDRVSFGLLSTEDLAVAKERDPFMPKSRKLLAVPFLGKDVPSRSSEFSHPDVVIGLTTLAYRYEGSFLFVFALSRSCGGVAHLFSCFLVFLAPPVLAYMYNVGNHGKKASA